MIQLVTATQPDESVEEPLFESLYPQELAGRLRRLRLVQSFSQSLASGSSIPGDSYYTYTWSDSHGAIELAHSDASVFNLSMPASGSLWALQRQESGYVYYVMVRQSVGDSEELRPHFGQSTTARMNDVVRRRLMALLRSTHDEPFEDGSPSQLSKGLTALVSAHKSSVLNVLEDMIRDESIPEDLTSELLRIVGRLSDPATKDMRLRLLIANLRAPLPKIRMSTLVGLSLLKDKRAIPHLREQFVQESSTLLRERLERLIIILETT